MKKILVIIPMLALILSGFTLIVNNASIVGVYGVDNNDPSHIELQLKSDKTFTYQDFSDPSHKIKTSGTYEVKGQKIILHASEPVRFHNKWALSSDQQSIGARHGLCWYRLCRK